MSQKGYISKVKYEEPLGFFCAPAKTREEQADVEEFVR